MSEDPNTKGYSISEAAQELGVSTRTIRRHIKAGKITAVKIQGQFGEEYRIFELPKDVEEQIEDTVQEGAEQSQDNEKEKTKLIPADDAVSSLKIILDLQEKNIALAAQLGAATERIKNLESQIQLLSPPQEAPKKHWWQKIF
jgi:excisionase family DNA binding protein